MPSPSTHQDSPKVPEGVEVHTIPVSACRVCDVGRELVSIPSEPCGHDRETHGTTRALEVIAVVDLPKIRAQERQQLVRNGGELPDAFGELDPESNVGVLIRAALTVAEESAVSALLSDEVVEAVARGRAERYAEAGGASFEQLPEALREDFLAKTKADLQAAIEQVGGGQGA